MKNEAEKINNQQGNGVLPCVSKRKPEPPKPPKDREVHLGGFSRHKRD